MFGTENLLTGMAYDPMGHLIQSFYWIWIDDDTLSRTKFMLYCFEDMSGLKINYQKKWSFCSRNNYWRTKERV